MDENFLERRKKLLNRFLFQIVQKHYLFYSDEFQKFLFNQTEFHKIEFRAENYLEVGERYYKIFNEFSSQDMSVEVRVNIENFLNFCSISLPAFEKFEKSCKVALDSLTVYKNTNDIMINGLKTVGTILQKVTNISSIHVPERENITNPFETLLYWIRGEILDTKAMIETVQKLLSLPERKAEYSKKLENKKKKLENLKQGKSDLRSIFSSKSKDDQKKSSKKTVEFYEYEVTGIETILKITAWKLVNYDLPDYKQNKINNLSIAVQLFAELMQSELGKIKHQIGFLRVNNN